eukprot:295073-Chlamydomonas_euryale.AAC.6
MRRRAPRVRAWERWPAVGRNAARKPRQRCDEEHTIQAFPTQRRRRTACAHQLLLSQVAGTHFKKGKGLRAD